MFEKAKSANSLPFAQNGCLFMWGAYFCMAAYKCDVVVVLKMGAYIHGVLILCGCLLSRFYGNCNPTSLHHVTNMMNQMHGGERSQFHTASLYVK